MRRRGDELRRSYVPRLSSRAGYWFAARVRATAAEVAFSVSSGVPFTIQLPPQAKILGKERYSLRLSGPTPPVGMKLTCGKAAESALMVFKPPKSPAGKNLR